MKNRMKLGNMSWAIMKKLIGRGGRGVSVEGLMEIFKVVVKKRIMYEMEVYWEGR